MASGEQATRRVLVVVSAWEPALVADMHRARILAWELPPLGWQVEVLTPSASEVRQDIIETAAAAFFAPSTPVHVVGSFAARLWKALGSRTHTWKTLPPMASRLRRLLAEDRFDLVYFSTTTFNYFALGPRYCRAAGIPYVLDFHDPWARSGQCPAARGGLRTRLTDWLARRLEHSAVTRAAGIVAVSPTYLDDLRRRYGPSSPAWLAAGRAAVIPFGARAGDLDEAHRGLLVAPLTTSRFDEPILVTYVGAGGSIMQRGWRLVCEALAALRGRGDSRVERLRIRLMGTSYGWRPGDPRLLQAIADEAGVGDLVEEIPERVSYRGSLEALLRADGALVLGVDDAGYVPSKLSSYGLSGKPLLAVFRRDGPAYAEMVANPGIGHVLWFEDSEIMPAEDAAAEVGYFLEEALSRRKFDRTVALGPYLGEAMARRHVELFDACLEKAGS